MDSHNILVRFLILAGYFVSKALGIIPFKFDRQTNNVIKSKASVAYSCIVLVGLMGLGPYSKTILFQEERFLQQKPILSFVGFNRYIILNICAILTILIQLLK